MAGRIRVSLTEGHGTNFVAQLFHDFLDIMFAPKADAIKLFFCQILQLGAALLKHFRLNVQ